MAIKKLHRRYSPVSPLPLIPMSPTNPLPFLSLFHLKIPVSPFQPNVYMERFESMRMAFGSFFLHLHSCDPNSTLISWPRNKLPPLETVLQDPLLFFGPYSPLSHYPSTIKRLCSFLNKFWPNPTGGSVRCHVWINHSIPPGNLQAELSGYDKYQGKLYRAFLFRAKIVNDWLVPPAYRKQALPDPRTQTKTVYGIFTYQVIPELKEKIAPRLAQFKAEAECPSIWLPLPQSMKPTTAKTLGLALPIKGVQISLRFPSRLQPLLPLYPWLAALLELHWSTSWDLCLAQRIWMGKREYRLH